MSGIRVDIAVSVNKESMNKSSCKNVFLRFYLFTLLKLLVAAYRGALRTHSNIYNGFFCKNLNMLSKKPSIADFRLG